MPSSAEGSASEAELSWSEDWLREGEASEGWPGGEAWLGGGLGGSSEVESWLGGGPRQLLYSQAAYEEAMAKCERLLAARERSSGELRQRLARDGFDAEASEACIQRLQAVGLVDDERFCRIYVVSKRNQGWGMRRITMALRQLCIDADDYPEVMQEFDDEAEELRRAEEVLARYRGRARDAYAGRYRYLVSKGFSAGIVRQAMAAWREG